jgi:hypothetical protein
VAVAPARLAFCILTSWFENRQEEFRLPLSPEGDRPRRLFLWHEMDDVGAHGCAP